MRLLGSILLTVGFLAGAYISVSQVDTVPWTYYGASASVMVVGMLLLRLARKDELSRAGDKHTEDMAVLRTSLTSLIEKVRVIESAREDEDQLEVHRRIDAELMDDINRFVEARESMIPKLGMQRYADIMSPFANGERILNRAWSASADGYVDEVRTCVTRARGELETAAALLAEA